MQSYLQYRTLCQRLEAKLERAKARGSNEVSTDNDDLAEHYLQRPPSTPDSNNTHTTSQHLTTSETLHQTGTNLAAVLSGVDFRNAGESTAHFSKAFVVKFDSHKDPMNPQNWSLTKRALCILNIGVLTLIVGSAASIDSAVIPQAAAEFGVSEIVEALATALVSGTTTFRRLTNNSLT